MKKATLMALAGALTMATANVNAETHATEHVMEAKMMKTKAAEGKCGATSETKAAEGKCGEGKCGAANSMKADEGKCGEGKCGATAADSNKKAMKPAAPKAAEGKCGEGKCGASK